MTRYIDGITVGLVNPQCIGLIGSGVVVHIPSFFAEVDKLQEQGVLPLPAQSAAMFLR